MKALVLLVASVCISLAPASCGGPRDAAAPPVALVVTPDAGAGVGGVASRDAGAAEGARRVYASRELGITLEPGDFAVTASAGPKPVVTLDGGFSVEQPHGLASPGQDTRQYFRGRISIHEADVRASVKRDSPALEPVLYPEGKFVPSEGLGERRTIGGRSGIVVLWGAHGYAYRDYYVRLEARRTLVARFGVVGDFVQTVEHGPPEEAQVAAIERLIASLRIE